MGYLFMGLCLESYKVIPTRNYLGAYGYVHFGNVLTHSLHCPSVPCLTRKPNSSHLRLPFVSLQPDFPNFPSIRARNRTL